MDLRNLLEGRSITAAFKHFTCPAKGWLPVWESAVTQFLISKGWASLRTGDRGDLRSLGHRLLRMA
jgi:hypothetical protein